MSGYIPLPMTVPEAARVLTQRYGLAVSPDKVRRVFDRLGSGGLRVGAVRLILPATLDAIVRELKADDYLPDVPAVAIASSESIVPIEPAASTPMPDPTSHPSPRRNCR